VYQIAVALFFLYRQMGPSCFAGTHYYALRNVAHNSLCTVYAHIYRTQLF
jgi:hypothetical protein